MITIHPRSYYIGTSAERAALVLPADAVGAFFFDTTVSGLYVWDGSAWQPAGAGFPAGSWLDTTSGAMDWAPDSVALLHGGVLAEESDPDDAFSAAVSGDVVLVPPGTWTLSSAHSLTGVSIHGMGPATKCILQATSDVGATLLQTNGGELSNFTLKYLNCDIVADRFALKILNGRAFNVHGECYNLQNSGYATGIYLLNSVGILCHGLATGNANKSGIAGGGDTVELYFCTGETSSATYSMAVGISVSATLSHVLWCHGISPGTYGQGISLSSTSYTLFCWGDGGSTDFAVSGSVYFYDCQYDTLTGSPTFLPGDRAGKGRNEVITGAWTFGNTVTLNGNWLILDDANTGFCVVSGDVVTFRAGGSDVMKFAAGAIKGVSGSVPQLGTTTDAEKWGTIYLAQGKTVYLRGPASSSHSGVEADLLAKVGHILDGGLPANPYPSSRNADDAEFNNSVQALNNTIGTHAAGDYWEWKDDANWDPPTATYETYNINSQRLSNLYVRKSTTAVNPSALVGDITPPSETGVYFVEVVYGPGVQWNKLGTYAGVRLIDTTSGKYMRIALVDDAAAGLSIECYFDTGGGENNPFSVDFGHALGTVILAMRRYVSGGNAYGRWYYCLEGTGSPFHVEMETRIGMQILGAQANFIPDELWLEFDDGAYLSWFIDSVRRG